MKKTFVCDESMIITIPIGSLEDAREGQLMPEKFQCVYRDSYKIFAIKGKPKPLGAAQAIAGVFILSLGLIVTQTHGFILFYTLPSVLGTVNLYYASVLVLPVSAVTFQFPCMRSIKFVITGILSYAAGQSPNMHVTKLSFSLNIISFFWSIVAVGFSCTFWFYMPSHPYHDTYLKVHEGINGLIMTLLVVEKLIALFLIYWLSKAVCRQHFNTLPTILLKQSD